MDEKLTLKGGGHLPLSFQGEWSGSGAPAGTADGWGAAGTWLSLAGPSAHCQGPGPPPGVSCPDAEGCRTPTQTEGHCSQRRQAREGQRGMQPKGSLGDAGRTVRSWGFSHFRKPHKPGPHDPCSTLSVKPLSGTIHTHTLTLKCTGNSESQPHTGAATILRTSLVKVAEGSGWGADDSSASNP